MEGGLGTGTEGPAARDDAALLPRVWAFMDPAVDALPHDELLDAVLERIRRAFGAHAAALVLIGGPDDDSRFGTPADDPVWALAGEQVAVEVHVGQQCVGRLQLALSAPGAITDTERAALEISAARLGRGVASRRQEIDAGRAEERLRSENEVVEHLYRISSALMAEHELHDVVQRVTEEGTALAGAQFGAFFYNTVGAAGESLTLYTIAGVPRSAFDRFPMPRNTQIFDPTFRGVGIMRSGDITQDPRYGHNSPYQGLPTGHLPVRSYLAVPVMARSGEVLGGLFFGHGEPDRFGEEAERNLTAVALLAAVAIENAGLHESAQRELEASRSAYLERDHVARVLQESLMPPRLPEIPGLELAARYSPGEGIVGGDFYDVFPIREGLWGAAIGDVQGKDARAAAMTSVVRHTLHTSALQRTDPSDALRVVNQVVLQEQDPEDPRFSSVQFVVLEPNEGGVHARLASAGHPPALLVRAAGGVEECRPPGSLLGVSEDILSEEMALDLAPGDTLVLYTDGLTEARSGQGLLGEERVKALLADELGTPPARLAISLDELAEHFSGGRRRDDLAILVIRVRG